MKTKLATFAGGCFWCMEAAFEGVEGVIEARSGYIGGDEENPSYEEVSSGKTGHYEAVQIRYDPEKIGYEELLDVFWQQIDPTDAGGQFADRGSQYRTVIFYHDDDQRRKAQNSRNALERSGKFDKPIVTEIKESDKFYPAEEYHQDYHKKKKSRYEAYKKGSGREDFIGSVWGKDTYDQEKKSLNPLQYKITQECGTEKPFDNKYWNNTKEGIYVDIVSGEPLFSSKDKFKSGTGWPSFTNPIDSSAVNEKDDRSLGMQRIEVRSKEADSHLGHVFDDGPDPKGRRYCINSASLRFVPKENLEEEGYGEYKMLFKANN